MNICPETIIISTGCNVSLCLFLTIIKYDNKNLNISFATCHCGITRSVYVVLLYLKIKYQYYVIVIEIRNDITIFKGTHQEVKQQHIL